MLKPLITGTTVLVIICVTSCRAAILRNNALMNKMVSHFHQDHAPPQREQETRVESPKSDKVMSLMQNVLCRNFPKIPCSMIMQDEKLSKLIEKSIQQIKYKSMSLEKTTQAPGYFTLFPTINSEELSNFLRIKEQAFNEHIENETRHKRKHKNTENHEQGRSKNSPRNIREPMRQLFNGRKIRKFYPHKIKYKDKANRNEVNNSEEMSMSGETLDMHDKNPHLNFKAEPADPPVWRIDYMKHGEPSLSNLMVYEDDRLKAKLIKTGPNVILDETVLEPSVRKDVLHPDVYIKKNYVRRHTNGDSEEMD